MRIISQDGLIDVPYDGICIEILEFNDKEIGITARSAHITNDMEAMIMAQYSNEEKAMEAMALLHQEYGKTVGRYYVSPRVFMFPQEDEI